MQSQSHPQARADWIGILCSVGCAIHCAATPILLSILPSISSIKWLADPLFHQVVAAICCVIVIRAILPGIKSHRDWRVGALASSGIGLLFVAAFVLPDQCCSHSTPSTQQISDTDEPVDQTLSTSRIRLVSAPIKHTHQHEDHSHGHDHADCPLHSHDHDSHDHAKHCDSGTCSSDSWGKTLFSLDQLKASIGDSKATFLAGLQPYLSPMGGLLLIVAHIMNIRLQCCRSATCRSKDSHH